MSDIDCLVIGAGVVGRVWAGRAALPEGGGGGGGTEPLGTSTPTGDGPVA